MTSAEAIAALHGGTRLSVVIGSGDMTADDLRAAFASSGPAMITTEQAAQRFGFQPDYWRGVAKDTPGAVKGRHWLLPIAACEAHVAARAQARRTPPAWSKAPHAPSARPRGLQAR